MIVTIITIMLVVTTVDNHGGNCGDDQDNCNGNRHNNGGDYNGGKFEIF